MFRRWFLRTTAYLIIMALIPALMSGCGYMEQDRNGLLTGQENQSGSVNDSPSAGVDRGPVRGGSLELFTMPPDTLNPILTKNKYVLEMLKVGFEGLFELDEHNMPQPKLAEGWFVQDDGLTWIIQLRKGVMWHDGIPLTASDVVFTYEAILGSNGNYKKNLEKILILEVINDTTLKIMLREPYSFLPECLVFPILPKHYFLNEDFLTTPRNMKPVGTGPYKFKEITSDRIVWVPNENWWNKNPDEEGKTEYPLFSRLDFYIFSSPEEALENFQDKDLDFLQVDDGEWKRYSGRSDLRIKKLSNGTYDFLAFNTSRPVFSDKNVRKAIAVSLDRSVINDLGKGRVILSDLPMPKEAWYVNKEIFVGSNAEQGKRMLEDSGWKPGWNGILSKNINGVYTQLDFEILVNENNELRVAVANSIRDQLKNLGINVRVNAVSWDQYIWLVESRYYDAVIGGWNIPDVPDYSFAYSSREADKGLNLSCMKNGTIDSLLDEIKKENDYERKRKLFYSLESAIMDEMPYVGLYFTDTVVMFKNSIKGNVQPQSHNLLFEIESWYRPAY